MEGDRPRSAAHHQWTPLARALSATGDHWTLAIVLALARGRTRLSVLRRRLPGISTGVLDRYVRQMVKLGLVSRRRFREMPPRVELELTESGRELVPIAGALARWGMRRMWSAPRHGEHIDLDGLLCLLPTLLEEDSGLPDGTVTASVGVGEASVMRTFRIAAGRLKLIEEAPGKGAPEDANGASARIEGDWAAWIAALGPQADLGSLRISGDVELAQRLLAKLPRSA